MKNPLSQSKIWRLSFNSLRRTLWLWRGLPMTTVSKSRNWTKLSSRAKRPLRRTDWQSKQTSTSFWRPCQAPTRSWSPAKLSKAIPPLRDKPNLSLKMSRLPWVPLTNALARTQRQQSTGQTQEGRSQAVCLTNLLNLRCRALLPRRSQVLSGQRVD